MATTKKIVKKDDATDKKKSTTAKKKATTAKKKTNVKKEVESTGVVDEFLNENIGKVVTETETPKPEKKKVTSKEKATATKKTDENKLIDAEAELNEILSQQITEENIRVADEIEKAINKQKELNKKLDKLALAEDLQEPPQDIATKCEIVDASGEIEAVKPTDDDVKVPEEKWKELGLTEETLNNINEITDKIAENDETKEPNNAVYPPIAEPTEKETPITVDDLRVNLEAKPQQRFTYVNTSMGVKYD